MTISKPLVLGFALDAKQSGNLRLMCMRHKLRFLIIPQEDHAQTIGALCGISARAENTDPSVTLPEGMLLFAGLSDAQLSAFINDCRKQKTARPSLMAILTETNAAWTPLLLWSQLAEEREAFQKKMHAIHERKETHGSTENQN